VREGDFIAYGCNYYEILNLIEPREMFGQVNNKVEISAKCLQARKDIFNGQ